jgi:DNA-binding beta-propeller fold protein YncE
MAASGVIACGGAMRSKSSTTRASIASATVVAILLAACERGDSQPSSSAAANAGPAAPAASAARSERWSYQDWPTGPYKVAESWPKPLPDTRHSHDGWTWGSFGGVYAESPDRIWIAMRGELPLPAAAAPWTPYAALTPPRTSTGNGDGITATCGDEPKRGWERRFEHSIIVVNRAGELVDEWPELEKLFSAGPCGRGPHQIKISPYDPEKHVWIIDDQLHMIYRFTYDGKLEMSKGELGLRGRGPNTFDRPTDVAWLPDGTYFITDGYGGTRVAKYDKNDNFVKDWGGPPKDPQNPGPNEFNTVHSVAISKDQRLFVVDRGHQRMQVFDVDGNFLYMFPLRSPHWPASQGTLVTNHFIDDKGFIWAGDAFTNRILKFDLDGNFLYSWGAAGPQPGRLGCSHGITTDQLGNLYIADCFAGRVQKFEPIPGADPDKIAGQILRTWDTWKP